MEERESKVNGSFFCFISDLLKWCMCSLLWEKYSELNLFQGTPIQNGNYTSHKYRPILWKQLTNDQAFHHLTCLRVWNALDVSNQTHRCRYEASEIILTGYVIIFACSFFPNVHTRPVRSRLGERLVYMSCFSSNTVMRSSDDPSPEVIPATLGKKLISVTTATVDKTGVQSLTCTRAPLPAVI